jgi:hypothetical protein
MELIKAEIQKHTNTILSSANRIRTNVTGVVQRVIMPIVNFWHSLKASERLYLSALISIPLLGESLVLASILTVIGLTMEFWPRFVGWWDTLAGKAIFLLFYGAIANFAVADAGSYVNDVLKISAESVTYAHNFAILLSLPSWFLGVTFITLLLFQIFMPFYLILLLILKPFGVKLIKVFSKSNHPIFCNLVRTIVSSILIYQIVLLLEVIAPIPGIHGNLISKTNDNVQIEASTTKNTDDIVPVELPAQNAPTQSADVQTLAPQENNAELTKQQKQKQILDEVTNKFFDPEQVAEMQKAFEQAEQDPNFKELVSKAKNGEKGIQVSAKLDFLNHHDQIIKMAIAYFAYEFEADDYSRCQLAPGTRAIELNDYEFLEVKENPDAEFHFDFAVKKCNSPGLKNLLSQ